MADTTEKARLAALVLEREDEASRCWILTRATGATYAGNWPATTHFRSEGDALVQAGVDTGWQPRQLDRLCVTITCGGCLDTFGGDSTAHFDDLEEAHIAIGECTDWNRWTILPNGYLCDVCNPTDADPKPQEVAVHG